MRQLKAEVGELARLAHTDALTGLPNRRALERALARELARARRFGQPLSLAIIDLDHFKAINDTHGHQTGDQLLKQATAAWNRQLRAEDMLARNDGDEFTALLINCPLEAATKLIERLRAATPRGQTCSAGVVGWDGSEPPEALIARADRALYAANTPGATLPSPPTVDGCAFSGITSELLHRLRFACRKPAALASGRAESASC